MHLEAAVAHVEPARSRFCASAGGLSLAARPERWSVAIAGFRRHVCILNCGQSHLLTTFPLRDVSADEVDTNQRRDSCDDDGDALGRTVRAPVVSSNHNALNFLAVLTLVDDVVDDLVGNFGVPVGYVTDDLDHRRHEQLHLSDALTDRDRGQRGLISSLGFAAADSDGSGVTGIGSASTGSSASDLGSFTRGEVSAMS
ncbi:hypothetical protein [Candidatus Poriferisodalis sp.]|uniref:hypothetical protein n=1 Tax=Candidatus Poriferisodalis sp. TaxID=3101277 RepID=UPI003D1212DD